MMKSPSSNEETATDTYCKSQPLRPLPHFLVVDDNFDLLSELKSLTSEKLYESARFLVTQVITRVNRAPDLYLLFEPALYAPYRELIRNVFTQLKIANSYHGPDGPVKDFPKTLHKLSSYIPFHVILNKVLEEIKTDLENEVQPLRVKENKRQAYKNMVIELHRVSTEKLQEQIRMISSVGQTV